MSDRDVEVIPETKKRGIMEQDTTIVGVVNLVEKGMTKEKLMEIFMPLLHEERKAMEIQRQLDLAAFQTHLTGLEEQNRKNCLEIISLRNQIVETENRLTHQMTEFQRDVLPLFSSLASYNNQRATVDFRNRAAALVGSQQAAPPSTSSQAESHPSYLVSAPLLAKPGILLQGSSSAVVTSAAPSPNKSAVRPPAVTNTSNNEGAQNEFTIVAKKSKMTGSVTHTYAKVAAGQLPSAKMAAPRAANYYATIDPTTEVHHTPHMPAAAAARTRDKEYVPKQQSASQGQRTAQTSRQPPSLRQQIQQAVSEAERAALLWRNTEGVTTEIGTVTASFPLSKTAIAHPMVGLKLAVKDASGVDPLAVSLLSRNSCVIYFDTALISVKMMGEMLQRKKCTLLDPRPVGDTDVERVARTYVRCGYFKLLRHSMLPLHDAPLLEKVLLKARDVVTSMPKEDRRRLNRMIQVDSAELLVGAVPREGQLHEEEAESELPADGEMEEEAVLADL